MVSVSGGCVTATSLTGTSQEALTLCVSGGASATATCGQVYVLHGPWTSRLPESCSSHGSDKGARSQQSQATPSSSQGLAAQYPPWPLHTDLTESDGQGPAEQWRRELPAARVAGRGQGPGRGPCSVGPKGFQQDQSPHGAPRPCPEGARGPRRQLSPPGAAGHFRQVGLPGSNLTKPVNSATAEVLTVTTCPTAACNHLNPDYLNGPAWLQACGRV